MQSVMNGFFTAGQLKLLYGMSSSMTSSVDDSEVIVIGDSDESGDSEVIEISTNGYESDEYMERYYSENDNTDLSSANSSSDDPILGLRHC